MPAFNCPVCKIRVQAPDGAEGKHVKCPGCSNAVMVPGAGGQPAAVAEVVAPGPAGMPMWAIWTIVGSALGLALLTMICIVSIAAVAMIGTTSSGTFGTVGTTIS